MQLTANAHTTNADRNLLSSPVNKILGLRKLTLDDSVLLTVLHLYWQLCLRYVRSGQVGHHKAGFSIKSID